MQIIYTPVALPGCCFICRGAQRESYIDTGVSHDYEGAFYICNLCINDMAHQMKYISEDEYKNLRMGKEESDRLNYELIKRVGGLEESLRALANAGYRVDPDVGVVIDGGYLPKDMDNPEYQSPERTESLGDGEGTTSESSDDEGMAELRSDDDSSGDFVLEF